MRFLHIIYSVARTIHYVTVFKLFAMGALLIFSFVQPVAAQTPVPVTDDDVNAVARDLYCPVCENVPLDVCPTKACVDWREEIRLKLIEGWTEDDIKQYFVQRFGDRVLATPPASGINLLAYVIPPIVILGSALLLYKVFRAWKKPAVVEIDTVAFSPDDGYIQLLEEQLKERDQ